MQPITGTVSAVPIAAKRKNLEPSLHSAVKPKCLLWYEKIKDHPKGREESDVCAKVYGHLRDDNMSTLAKIFGKFSKKQTTKKLAHLMPQPKLHLESSQTNPSVGAVTTFVASRSDGAALARLEDRVAACRSQRPATRAPTRKDGHLKVVRAGSRPHLLERGGRPQYAVSEERIRKQRSKLGQPTRAQIFRNRFIRRKMLAVNKDKNDSWWNRFNVKLYYNDFYR